MRAMRPHRTAVCGLAALTLGLAPAASAQDPSGNGHVVSGPLSKKDAHDFIKRQLPDEAPRLLLKDDRADFYSTASVHVQRPRLCDRLSRSLVNCTFRVRLRPDKAHRKANWWPIKCRGENLVARLDNGGLGGDTGHYVCVTVKP